MARIPPAELERLKTEVSVERLAEGRGVKLERRGKDLFGLCPFHEEETPSLVITPETNLWHCFGCGAGGDVIAWVQKAEGVSFRHAVELLRADLPLEASPAGSSSSSSSRPVKKSSVKKLPKLAKAEAKDQELLRRVVTYYHETLKASPEALEYLRGRGLENGEMVERFQLGFANRTLGYRLPEKNRKEGAEVRGKLRELGIYRTSGHEHLAGSIVVPLFDAEGRVVQMYGRKVTPRLRRGTPDHLYLPGPQRGVFNLAAIQTHREVILCEAILDALTFWCAGFRNVTTSYGTGGPNAELWEAFKKYGTERVLIAYDRDDAGEKAAARVAKELAEAGIAAYRVQFPKGMDANEYACKVRPAVKSLSLVVRSAVWLGEGKAPERELPVEIPREEASEETRDHVPATEEPEEAAKEEGVEAGESEAVGVGPAPVEESAIPETPAVLEEEDPAAERASAAEVLAPSELPSSAASPAPSEESSRPGPEEPPASRIPPPPPENTLERRGEEYWMRLEDRSYRVRGLQKNLSHAVMKVNLLVKREMPRGVPKGSGVHVDVLDLYQARPREAFAKRAGAELGVSETTLERDLGSLLGALEAAQDEEIAKALHPAPESHPMTEEEREEALALLRDEDLLGAILRDFAACGVVGEEVNKLAGYLAAVSRKLEKPLAILMQSNSAAGKSSLMEATLAFMPEEEQVCYSAMTGQSLFYMADTDLRHKILAIAEEEGAQRASYALKLLQSEGQLTIASTGKDPVTGRLQTESYKVEGPVMIFLTTTATDVDEELLNRCLVLTVDEGRDQTEAIHREQRASHTLEGKLRRRRRERILRRHRNAQRLLQPLLVDNPYAGQLTFQGHQTRFRRDHEKYLTLIETVTLLHQYQRKRKVCREGAEEIPYIEVTLEDIRLANRLAHVILGRSVDELPPQTRKFLQSLVAMVETRCQEQGVERGSYRFRRREVREWTGLANSQVAIHLSRLEELEYLLVHAGKRGKSLVYELTYERAPEDGAPFFPGLLDAGELGATTQGYDDHLPEGEGHLPVSKGQLPVSKAHLPEPGGQLPESFRPASGHLPGPFRTLVETTESLSQTSSSLSSERENPEIPETARPGSPRSAPRVVAVPVVAAVDSPPSRPPRVNGGGKPLTPTEADVA